jgi:glycosyltransferase involved in cell wall biosynthesis
MKVLLISTCDLDGGAARAAYRLHQGLQSCGTPSQMLVRAKSSLDSTVISNRTAIARLGSVLDYIPLRFYKSRNRKVMFSPQYFPDSVVAQVAKLAPDVINLHWACNGYLRIESLARFNKPIVWTLHDMWAFTGGCHYTQECDRYKVACGQCPQLNSNKEQDLSRWIWQRKAKAWKNLDLTLVTPSSWLAKCASSSALFQDVRVEAIPNGLDTQVYKPIERQLARKILNLPQDKQLILFGAGSATSDLRKGFHLLQAALQKLGQSDLKEQAHLVVFGGGNSNDSSELGLTSHYLGKLSDDTSLAIAYAAADVFVAPSVQDNLPNTVMESLACGTPCVAFNIGGMPEMIEHQQNGYLAQPFEIDDLAHGIAWVLADQQHQRLCDRAREKVEQEFTKEIQARRYSDLFEQVSCQQEIKKI